MQVTECAEVFAEDNPNWGRLIGGMTLKARRKSLEMLQEQCREMGQPLTSKQLEAIDGALLETAVGAMKFDRRVNRKHAKH